MLEWQSEKSKPLLISNRQHCWESGKKSAAQFWCCKAVLSLEGAEKLKSFWSCITQFWAGGAAEGEIGREESSSNDAPWVYAYWKTLKSVFEYTLAQWYRNPHRDSWVPAMIFYCDGNSDDLCCKTL